MFSIKPQINKLLAATVILVIVCLFSLLTFFIPELSPLNEHASWFQRSGSLVVIASIWVQFNLVLTESYTNPYDERIAFVNIPKWFNKLHRYISIYTILAAIFGTFIWGYGDTFI